MWRSGVGVDANGALIYAGGNSLSVLSLARTLQAAGAVRAMELDINTDWVSAYTYVNDPATDPNAPVIGLKLGGDMARGGDRYLQLGERDFFAFFADPKAPSCDGPVDDDHDVNAHDHGAQDRSSHHHAGANEDELARRRVRVSRPQVRELSGFEVQAAGVHAVAEAVRAGTVVEHVAEVTTAAPADDLGALHPELAVGLGLDRFGHQRLGEARPAGARLELRVRVEQLGAATAQR